MINPVDMVERKLSGVYSTMPLEIPYEVFELFVANLMANMENCGMEMQRSEVALNPGIHIAFERCMNNMISAFSWQHTHLQFDPSMIIQTLYPEELKAGLEKQEAKAERAREYHARVRAEHARIRQEQAKKDRLEIEEMMRKHKADELAELEKKQEFEKQKLESNKQTETTIGIKNKVLRYIVNCFKDEK